MAGERTEQATQHRRDKARKDGDILHSRELSAAAGMLAGVMVLGAMGGHLLILWRNSFASFLDLGQPARSAPSAPPCPRPSRATRARPGRTSTTWPPTPAATTATRPSKAKSVL